MDKITVLLVVSLLMFWAGRRVGNMSDGPMTFLDGAAIGIGSVILLVTLMNIAHHVHNWTQN